MIKTTLLATAVSLLSLPALATPIGQEVPFGMICDAPETLTEMALTLYGEVEVQVDNHPERGEYHFFGDVADGSWTAMKVGDNGQWCVVAFGTEWTAQDRF
jgi:hypothetical protein